jgi:hypothetical protein
LLGAESILCRALHEHETSKQYSPIQLGEILSRRSFTNSGEVNPLSIKKNNSQRVVWDEGLKIEDDKDWQPKSVLAIIDALDAIRWCYILIDMGSESAVNKWFDTLEARVRLRQHKTDQFRQYYEAQAWKLCLHLRGGHTFQEASDLALNDLELFHECMNKEVATNKGAGTKGTKRKKQDDDHQQDKPKGKGRWESRKNDYRPDSDKDKDKDKDGGDKGGKWGSSGSRWGGQQKWETQRWDSRRK